MGGITRLAFFSLTLETVAVVFLVFFFFCICGLRRLACVRAWTESFFAYCTTTEFFKGERHSRPVTYLVTVSRLACCV